MDDLGNQMPMPRNAGVHSFGEESKPREPLVEIRNGHPYPASRHVQQMNNRARPTFHLS